MQSETDPAPMLPVIGLRLAEGRSGSTLLMQLLATSDEVVFDSMYPAEYRFLSYFARMASMMSEPFDETRHVGVTPFFFGDRPRWGPIPFATEVVEIDRLSGPILRYLWQAWTEEARHSTPHAKLYAEKLAVSAATVVELTAESSLQVGFLDRADREVPRHRPDTDIEEDEIRADPEAGGQALSKPSDRHRVANISVAAGDNEATSCIERQRRVLPHPGHRVGRGQRDRPEDANTDAAGARLGSIRGIPSCRSTRLTANGNSTRNRLQNTAVWACVLP